jgi:hypothetical protein
MRLHRTIGKPITLDDLREKVDLLARATGCPMRFIASRDRTKSKGYAIAVAEGATWEMPSILSRGDIGRTRREADKTLDAMLAAVCLAKGNDFLRIIDTQDRQAAANALKNL